MSAGKTSIPKLDAVWDIGGMQKSQRSSCFHMPEFKGEATLVPSFEPSYVSYTYGSASSFFKPSKCLKLVAYYPSTRVYRSKTVIPPMDFLSQVHISPKAPGLI